MKIFLCLAFVLLAGTAISQVPSIKNIKLKSKASYTEAEPKVIDCAKYVISTPPGAASRNECAEFILKWMDGARDYTFEVDASLIHNEDGELLEVLLSSMVGFVLENKSQPPDTKTVKLTAVRALFTYCADSTHNTPLPKNLQKLLQADQEGKLAEALNY